MVKPATFSDFELLMICVGALFVCLAVGYFCYWIDRRNRKK